jgi:hypothetical protein
MQNSSGQGPAAEVPAEVDRWNWGAFLLTWIWGIGNSTLIALLAFIPLVGIVMMFVLGARGSAWAWQNKKWDSVEEFKAVQRKWAQWALIAYAVLIVFFACLFFAIVAAFKSSDAYKMGVARLEASQQAVQFLGEPISTGMPMGNIRISGPTGTANLSFAVDGAKGKGTIYLEASKELGQWRMNRIVLEEAGTGDRIDLNK